MPISFNLYLLIPQFLKKERYLLYLLSLITLVVLCVFCFEWFFDAIINNLFKNYFFISYHINTSFAVILIISIIISTLIKLAEDWFYFNQVRNKLINDAHQITQSQLTALRAQINPHFLFNALNVIYAMSLEQRSDTKDAVLQLSDILRYVIYDANTNKVTLKQELELIHNYISFQKNRKTDDLNVLFNKRIENTDFKIYPMLLLPLLENAYKHGATNLKGNNFITISLDQKENTVQFQIENSVLSAIKNHEDENKGVGLKNTIENLNMIYPNKHSIKVEEDSLSYKVTLLITV